MPILLAEMKSLQTLYFCQKIVAMELIHVSCTPYIISTGSGSLYWYGIMIGEECYRFYRLKCLFIDFDKLVNFYTVVYTYIAFVIVSFHVWMQNIVTTNLNVCYAKFDSVTSSIYVNLRFLFPLPCLFLNKLLTEKEKSRLCGLIWISQKSIWSEFPLEESLALHRCWLTYFFVCKNWNHFKNIQFHSSI